MFYIYHIPGKKIGVTRDLNKRVTEQQGYKKGEYEVLETSKDISYISQKEIRLQKLYGYKVDRQLYSEVLKLKSNKMKLNITETTTTFPIPLNKLKGHLMDNKKLNWETTFGEFKISKKTIPWILHNAKASMYNKDRCFVYNKAYYEAFIAEPALREAETDRFHEIRLWAAARGIYTKGDVKTQYIKLLEETGELAKAILTDDRAEIIDAIGDCVVVLTNLAKLADLNIEDCIDSAYNEISNRKGEMKNGTFVKQTM
jgi:NTP pyrophosphatase (non-canonical NTP hydrolase)